MTGGEPRRKEGHRGSVRPFWERLWNRGTPKPGFLQDGGAPGFQEAEGIWPFLCLSLELPPAPPAPALPAVLPAVSMTVPASLRAHSVHVVLSPLPRPLRPSSVPAPAHPAAQPRAPVGAHCPPLATALRCLLTRPFGLGQWSAHSPPRPPAECVTPERAEPGRLTSGPSTSPECGLQGALALHDLRMSSKHTVCLPHVAGRGPSVPPGWPNPAADHPWGPPGRGAPSGRPPVGSIFNPEAFATSLFISLPS